MATQREKQLAITLLKERIERATGKKVILKEGTWSLPTTPAAVAKAGSLLLEIKKLKDKLYPVLGDDILFDGLDSALARGKELLKIALDQNPDLKSQMTGLGLKTESVNLIKEEGAPKDEAFYNSLIDQIGFVSSDGDIETLGAEFVERLPNFGVYCYEAPSFEGTSSYGWILSKTPIDPFDLKVVDHMASGTEYDEAIEIAKEEE